MKNKRKEKLRKNKKRKIKRFLHHLKLQEIAIGHTVEWLEKLKRKYRDLGKDFS